MTNIKEIKNRIGSVSFTKQITKAMKMVAASKLRKAQKKIVSINFYYEKLNNILKNIYPDIYSIIYNLYIKTRKLNNLLIVVITSDRGLCGSFNSFLFRVILEYIKNISYKKIKILPIGKKGLIFFKAKKFNIINNYFKLFHNLNFDNSNKLSNYLISEFQNFLYDRIIIFYNKFINNTLQKPTLEEFLPIKKEFSLNKKIDYIYEPFISKIGKNLIPNLLRMQLYKNILNSLISEHASRMIAMGKATDNATDLLKDLKITYNRTRQAAITKEMLEIVNGAEALK